MNEYELPQGYDTTRSEEFRRVWRDVKKYPRVNLIAQDGDTDTTSWVRHKGACENESYLSRWVGYAIPKPLKVKK